MLTYISDVGDENLVNVSREVENLFLYYSVMTLDSQDL